MNEEWKQRYWLRYFQHHNAQGCSIEPKNERREPHKYSREFEIPGYRFTDLHIYAYHKPYKFAIDCNCPEGNFIGVGLVLDDGDPLDYFSALKKEQDAIEREVGAKLIWHGPDKKRCRLVLLKKNTDPTDSSKWPEQHKWLCENLQKMYDVLVPRLKKL